jgi:putative glutamine amidotransferase
MPPIIGLTTYGVSESHTKTPFYNSFYALPGLYVDAVRRAGAIPLLIPPGDNHWKSLLNAVDAVILTGGTDVDPAHYNGNSEHPHLYAPDKIRDKTEIEFVRRIAATKNKPMLCICRGMQVLNVALGGTMHEHILDVREKDIHRNANGEWTTHNCYVESGSELARVMDAETVNTYSGHHQAVKDIAPGLQVVATASDGIIEALIMPEHPFLIGVQWHPEKSAASDPTQQRLFDGLVEAVRMRVM